MPKGDEKQMEEFTRVELQGITEKAERMAKVEYLPHQDNPGRRRAFQRLADAANVLDAFIARDKND